LTFFCLQLLSVCRATKNKANSRLDALPRVLIFHESCLELSIKSHHHVHLIAILFESLKKHSLSKTLTFFCFSSSILLLVCFCHLSHCLYVSGYCEPLLSFCEMKTFRGSTAIVAPCRLSSVQESWFDAFRDLKNIKYEKGLSTMEYIYGNKAAFYVLCSAVCTNHITTSCYTI
jgi:hypothetical protein